MKITLPYLMIAKMPQTKVKYFVLVLLAKMFYTHHPSDPPLNQQKNLNTMITCD